MRDMQRRLEMKQMMLNKINEMVCKNCNKESKLATICKVCGKSLCENCQKICERCGDSICDEHLEKQYRIKRGYEDVIILCEFCKETFKM